MYSYKELLTEATPVYHLSFEPANLNSEAIEERYLGEDAMLDYISQGNLQGCLSIFRRGHENSLPADMQDVYNRYPGNQLRSFKNSMLSLNTLCRVAARRGGVTAFVVSTVSYKYALIIESAPCIDFLYNKVAPVMLGDYCMQVRDYSVKHYSQQTREIANYILNQLHTPLTVNQLAGIFYLNPSSLSRKFKRETGFSVTEYINTHRVRLAQYYLEKGNHNISEVACLSGFSDGNYFCRVFKKITSITPSQYIKNVHTEGMLI